MNAVSVDAFVIIIIVGNLWVWGGFRVVSNINLSYRILIIVKIHISPIC